MRAGAGGKLISDGRTITGFVIVINLLQCHPVTVAQLTEYRFTGAENTHWHAVSQNSHRLLLQTAIVSGQHTHQQVKAASGDILLLSRADNFNPRCHVGLRVHNKAEAALLAGIISNNSLIFLALIKTKAQLRLAAGTGDQICVTVHRKVLAKLIHPAAIGQQTVNNEVLQASIILQLKGHAKVGTRAHPKFGIFQSGTVGYVTVGAKVLKRQLRWHILYYRQQ